jgi:hypothetical protein
MSAFKRKPCGSAFLVALSVVLGAGGASAHEPDEQSLSFSGFGTLGVVHSSEGNADFTSSTFKPNGAGYSHAWSAEVDSLIAGQATAVLSRRLSAVLQVIAEQNYDGTYRPHVEWANVNYRFTPDLGVRLGRTVLPIFMVADSRKVGYANPWVRPPVEVYSLVPVTTNDGIDAVYRMPVGDANATFQFTAGQSDNRFPDTGANPGVTVEARDVAALVATYERGFAAVRLNAGRARVTIPELEQILGGFRQFGPAGAAIADRYGIRDRGITFAGLGASYDPGPWFVMGEWSRIDAPPLVGAKSGWYVTGGRRAGSITAFATYASARADSLADPGLAVAALPAALVEPATRLNAALNSFLATKVVQDTISVGVRWDFAKDVAFKLQFDHTRIGDGSNGALRDPQPGFAPGGKYDLVSATFDFIF